MSRLSRPAHRSLGRRVGVAGLSLVAGALGGWVAGLLRPPASPHVEHAFDDTAEHAASGR